jgi:FkbM family methyltransferase
MSIKRSALNASVAVLKRAVGVVGGGQQAKILASISERLTPIVVQETPVGSVRIFCLGGLSEYRARTLLTKEPETIEWLNGFRPGDVLWDVGANIGIYSLYAAMRKTRVLAFEPAPGNFFLLSRNVEINGFDDRISALCIAFNDRTCLDTFHMANTELGASLNGFGAAVDWQGAEYEAKFRQSMLGFTIDDFIAQFSPAFPTHIKIDVDGIEQKILIGARRTLADPRMRSVLVELNTAQGDEYRETLGLFSDAGFTLAVKEQRAPDDDAPLGALLNHIFVRER